MSVLVFPRSVHVHVTFQDRRKQASNWLDGANFFFLPYTELGVDVKVSEMLGDGLIEDIVKKVMTRLKA